ncbi:MAG: hypothetical protein LBL33_03925 [Tannerella sp.]|jgi:hypothetical protein|nr:hypothetical protein [Tannerella sp.]
MSPYCCVIAGINPSKALLKAVSRYDNIAVEANPSVERINELIRMAQINLLITFQGTFLKIKFLNSMFTGRHVVVNPMSGLDDLCHIADTPGKMIAVYQELIKKPFFTDILEERRKQLFPVFSNEYQSKGLIGMIV